MHVKLYLELPHHNDLAEQDNPNFTDWWVNLHHESLYLEWSAIPNIGETLSLRTENGSEIYGVVKERQWCPELNAAYKDLVFILVEVTDIESGALY